MNLPKVRTVLSDPEDPKGSRLLLFRVQQEGVWVLRLLLIITCEANQSWS